MISPLIQVGIFSLLTITINAYGSHHVENPELNTISSTPFPSFSSAGSFASSYATSGAYSGSFSHGGPASSAQSGSIASSYPNSASGASLSTIHTPNKNAGAFVSHSSGANSPNTVVGKYWWMGPQSPFLLASKANPNCKPGQPCAGLQQFLNQIPANGCNQHGCGTSGTFNVNQNEQSGSTPIDISQNPFLTGQIKPVQPSDIPDGSQPMDLSKNPYLNGAISQPSGFTCKPETGCSSQTVNVGCNNPAGCNNPIQPVQPINANEGCGSGYACGGTSSGSGAYNVNVHQGNQQPLNINQNPFLKQPQGSHQQPSKNIPTVEPQQPIDISRNPFLNGNQPSSPQGIPTIKPQGIPTVRPQEIPSDYNQDQQKIPSYPQPQPINQNGKIKCNTPGFTCVPIAECHNGVINKYGQGIIQARSFTGFCEPESEVCCALTSTASTPSGGVSQEFKQTTSYAQSGSFSSSGTTSITNHIYHDSAPQASVGNGIYTNRNNLGPSTGGSYSTSGLVYVPPQQNPFANGNGPRGPQYLPPIQPQQIPEFIPPVSPNTPKTVYTTPKPIPSQTVYIPPKPTTPQPSARPVYTTSNQYLKPVTVPTTTPRPAPRPVYTTSNQYLKPVTVPTTTPRLAPRPVYTTSNQYLPPVTSPTTPRPTQVTREYLPPKPTDSNVIYVKTTTTTPRPRPSPNTYLPPYEPEGSVIDNTRLRPPVEPEPTDNNPNILVPRPTQRPGITFNTTPHPGCAAALKCVPIEYCTAEGVISNTTIALTREQNENRVPLSDCINEETKVIGKCCRDPTYKDPWPAGQLGLWNPNNGFDDGSYRGHDNGLSRTPAANQPGNRFVQQNEIPTYRPSNTQLTSGSLIKPVHVKPSTPFNRQTCGIRNINGKPSGNSPLGAAFGEISWQAMILQDTNRSLLCGGAIIKPNAVLTAAHCIYNIPANDILVKGGEWRLGIDEEPKPFQIVKVASIQIHPQYSPDNQLNDVAILHLAENFRLDSHINPICLPASNEDVENKYASANCITTGWGKEVLKIHIQNKIPNRIEMNLLQPDQCQASLSTLQSSPYQYNPNSCICGVPQEPQNNICDVDQGSALACDLGDGHYQLTGVYSWDTSCQAGNQLAAFTRLDINWINSALQNPLKSTPNNIGRQYKPTPIAGTNYYQSGVKGGPAGSSSYSASGSYSQNVPLYRPQYNYQQQQQYGQSEPPCDCAQG